MISLQLELYQDSPRVCGNNDFRELQSLLARLNELLVQSDLDLAFIMSFPAKLRQTEKQRWRLPVALRCTLLRVLLQLPYRTVPREPECNFLYQKFCAVWRLDRIWIPSAKTLERYKKKIPTPVLHDFMAQLNHAAAAPAGDSGEHRLPLAKPVNPGEAYVDTTVVKARGHHPLDWHLLRDTVCTLLNTIAQARKHGIYSRLPEALSDYRSTMNHLCIEMTQAHGRKDVEKKRKALLRLLKKYVRMVEKLAFGHLSKVRVKELFLD